ncbi:hypothetical protein [Pseudonocardia alni]|uniref:hypothetical protein n=1 Tax=Pseudonocardia alni TaxID=33907 RepID=UPI00333385BC
MSDKPLANRAQRRHWNKYVADASETYTEIELSEDTVITVHIPSADRLNEMAEAERNGDLWGQLRCLFGDDFDAVYEAAHDAPATALLNLVQDVTRDLGLAPDAEGNVTALSS